MGKGKGKGKGGGILEFWFVACWCEFVEFMSLASQMKKSKALFRKWVYSAMCEPVCRIQLHRNRSDPCYVNKSIKRTVQLQRGQRSGPKMKLSFNPAGQHPQDSTWIPVQHFFCVIFSFSNASFTDTCIISALFIPEGTFLWLCHVLTSGVVFWFMVCSDI